MWNDIDPQQRLLLPEYNGPQLVKLIVKTTGVKYVSCSWGEKASCVLTYGPVTLPRTFLSVWVEELEPAYRNASVSQAESVSSPCMECRLLPCVDGCSTCQISRLQQRLRGAVGGAEERRVWGRWQCGCVHQWHHSRRKDVLSSSQCGCNMENDGFPTSRCNPHLCSFFPPCLIRVQYPPNEYSQSCLLFVCMWVWVGGCKWAQLGII